MRIVAIHIQLAVRMIILSFGWLIQIKAVAAQCFFFIELRDTHMRRRAILSTGTQELNEPYRKKDRNRKKVSLIE